MTVVKSEGAKEGEYSWYLQGNEAAKEKAVFEGEIIKRYNVTKCCKVNPIHVINKGAGSGGDFIDSLQNEDVIFVWARAKVTVRKLSQSKQELM